MPLYPDAEAGVRPLDGFDDAVRRGRGGDERLPEAADGLVMTAVHAARPAGVNGGAERAREYQAVGHADGMCHVILRPGD